MLVAGEMRPGGNYLAAAKAGDVWQPVHDASIHSGKTGRRSQGESRRRSTCNQTSFRARSGRDSFGGSCMESLHWREALRGLNHGLHNPGRHARAAETRHRSSRVDDFGNAG